MISQDKNPVEWVLLVTGLDEAREHLDSLASAMAEAGSIDEEDYATQLGHIYAHLNRCWNARALESEIPEAGWEEFSNFPKDLRPVG